MKSIYLIAIIILCAFSGHAQNTQIANFCGTWSCSFVSQENEMQNSTFELLLEIDPTKQNAIKGWHCSVCRGGRRIDCTEKNEAPSLAGYLEKDTVYISFTSAFGGKGQAKLYLDKSGKQLIWKLIKHTGESYFPDYETLEKDNKAEN